MRVRIADEHGPCDDREVQLFLVGEDGWLTRAGLDRIDQMHMLVAIMRRVRMPRGGFVEHILASGELGRPPRKRLRVP